MFDKAFKRVNTFIDFRTNLVEGSSKRAGTKLEQESIKKQKMDEDKEIGELQSLIKVIPDVEEVAIDAVPLATKPPTIVYWKIHKEGKKNMEDLYKLVKSKYGSTRPVNDLDLILYGDLKIMFEPHVEDQVWTNQDDYKVFDWKLYDSCRVHSLRMQHVYIHMLVEKRYPLKPSTIIDMLNKKLQLLMEKLDDFRDKYQVQERIVGIRRLLDDLRVITAQIRKHPSGELFDSFSWRKKERGGEGKGSNLEYGLKSVLLPHSSAKRHSELSDKTV
ncbi:hypothetical protein Tco_1562107 [Tanacetum coccineum]